MNICNKLINDYKLKVLFVCYNNDFNCDNNHIKENLFTISEYKYNMHNLYVTKNFFTEEKEKFNLECHNNELREPLKYDSNFDYYEYYKKTIIYFLVDAIENNMKRKIL